MAAKSTGPLSQLTVENTIHLCELISLHEAVWDARHPNYRDTHVKREQWTSIMMHFREKTGISCTEEQLRKKFVSMRNSFTRELRMMRECRKSGTGRNDMRIPKWPFFEALQFLRPVITLSNLNATNLIQSSQSADIHETSSSQDALEAEEFASDDERLHLQAIEATVQTEQGGPICNSQSSTSVNFQASTPPPYGRKRKAATLDQLETTLQQYLQRKEDARKARMPSDGLDAWANNLITTMRSMKKRRMTLLRIAVDDIVNNALKEELESDTE